MILRRTHAYPRPIVSVMRFLRSLPIRFTLSSAPLLLIGCFSSGPGTGDPFDDHMYSHFSAVGRIQTAVMFGDMEEARSVADQLARHQELSDIPAGGAPYLEAMRTTAAKLAASHAPAETALLTAELGATCGTCHQVLGAGPSFQADGGGDQGSTTTMTRHIQGSDRLWEGLIGPSDASWAVGAGLLAEGTVDQEFRSALPGRGSMIVDVFRLGREAQLAQGQTDRARVYGRILQTCSQCHSMP